MSGWRHDKAGDAIDRNSPRYFSFDGKPLSGFAGDTLASALLASGTQVLGRSFKYHRPRGLWGLGGEEPNAIFDVTENGRTTPNTRATTESLRDGMALGSVNTAPDALRDRGAILDRLNRFLPGGFYYKTFMAFGWMRWEPMIRRMAGLGRLDSGHRPPADGPQVNAACDLLVIGAGPAGLAAARAAALAGRKVWLVDEAAEPGGSLRWRGGEIDGKDWRDFLRETSDAVQTAGGRILTETTLWGAFDHNLFAAWERRTGAPDRHWRIRAGDIVLAAGAIERPLWFANNDLPGVMSAEAALHYLALYGAVAGRKIVLATGSDASYPVAEALARAGCAVTLADARETPPPPPDGVHHLTSAKLTRAEGKRAVRSVVVNGRRHEADTVLVSGGYTPSVHLHCQAGGKLDWDAGSDSLVPRPGTSKLRVAGAANGAFGLAEALAQGHLAGGGEGNAPQAPAGNWQLAAMRPDPALPGRQWIDPQNDVTLKDVKLAEQEGYGSVEHLKRYTTLGMATDQGRNSNFAGLAAMSELTGRSIPETGTTTYRPPFAPVPLGVIAGPRRGALFNAPRRLALEDEHRGHSAGFREYGGWLRPSAYGPEDEADLAQAEARAARETAGIYDASPLGKIEVIGPGAAELLDYCGYVRLSTLKPGRARYGFILGESGIVHDDGVVFRLAEDRFIVSASSSHAASVRMILEEVRQDVFDPSRSFIHDVTAGFVTLSVTGPKSRDLLKAAGLPEQICDDDVMAHMSVMETDWNDHALRVARVSFTGDRSYELTVPARHGAALHRALDAARIEVDGRWIGMEAVMILRAEKGFILVGKDTDGLTMPHDLGWGGPRDKRTDEYLGRRSLFTSEAKADNRRQLVGLEIDGDTPLPTGAHLVPLGEERRSLGFVTSSYFSPTLNRPVALALLENGRAKIGGEVGTFHMGETGHARVCPSCALDPEWERLNA
ncbi:sarcosine oxidase subunit alpha family protein [Roseovarius sp. A46]|uniref:2Fe-2S iron-sulfur cluster-binding protein n=1 Tax=Roseovarius sp. A46 TaxID=2109331 RepID=UPI00101079D9|nr:2Fe-2S iron-sulfur cluster-binding protein [Roseovarius sp. A46]RXV59451.1 sarcosine oxidase subunit alpha family protein [Roseovarius sp. A46]